MRSRCTDYMLELCTHVFCDFFSTCFKCLDQCQDVCTRPTPRQQVMQQAAFHQSIRPALSAVQRQQALYNAIMDTQLCFPTRPKYTKRVNVYSCVFTTETLD